MRSNTDERLAALRAEVSRQDAEWERTKGFLEKLEGVAFAIPEDEPTVPTFSSHLPTYAVRG